jgi:hypothetical protein
MISVSDGAGRVAQTSNGGERDAPHPKEAEARAYTPEQIAGLTAAYEVVLATLNVVDRIDLAKYAIAPKLFELAESDRECRPALLYTRALTELDLQESRYFSPVGV